MFVITGVMLVTAFLLYRSSMKKKKRLYEMMKTGTSRIEDIQEDAIAVAEVMGEAGSFRQFVEVAGILGGDPVLEGEVTGTPCAYYKIEFRRKWEESYREQDNQGHMVEKVRAGSDLLYTNEESAPLYVKDETGRINLHTAGAEMRVSLTSCNQFYSGPMYQNLYVGRFSFMVNTLQPLAGERRLKGFILTETIIPVDIPVYVLGEATDEVNPMVIKRPEDKSKKMIIQLGTEESVKQRMESSIKGLRAGAIITVVVGILFAGLQILQSY